MSPGIQIIDPEERFCLAVEGARLFLRRLDSATVQAVERRYAGQKESGRINDELLDYVLLDWQGVTSPLGEVEVPCTRDNKLRLPTRVKLKIMAAAQNARAEDSAE